ncbi:hypothetical protein D1007_13259 [Hordeum vulgare]|nr:hypothetical protein D1007_13259 [Hordeum vulgare]
MASNSVFTELLKNYKLDGTNFTVWKRKMMFLLTAENIEYVISTAEPNKPDDDASDEEKDNYSKELKEWNKDNKRARIFILGSMSDSLAGEYETEVAAHRIMRQLEKDFDEVSLIKVLSLLNRFLTSKMADNTSVNEHLNKLCVLNEELKNAGYPFSEEVQVMVALNSLPHTWEQFKISFCHSERLLNKRNLRHHLLMEEDRKTSQGKERHSHHQELHLGEDRRRWQKKNQGGDLRDKINKKRNWEDRNGRGPNSNLDKRNFKCHSCGEYGHFRTECRNKKPYRQDDKSKKQHQDKHQATRRIILLLMPLPYSNVAAVGNAAVAGAPLRPCHVQSRSSPSRASAAHGPSPCITLLLVLPLLHPTAAPVTLERRQDVVAGILIEEPPGTALIGYKWDPEPLRQFSNLLEPTVVLPRPSIRLKPLALLLYGRRAVGHLWLNSGSSEPSCSSPAPSSLPKAHGTHSPS